MENGREFKYNAPVSSQEDVNKLFSQIHKHSEQDQLAVMRREIKFKKVVFSELPNDFVLFKQYNISAKQMYQNLLALHSIDAAHQVIVFIKDIFAIYAEWAVVKCPLIASRAFRATRNLTTKSGT